MKIKIIKKIEGGKMTNGVEKTKSRKIEKMKKYNYMVCNVRKKIL